MKESGDRVFHPSFAIASEGLGDRVREVKLETKYLIDSR